MCSEGTPQEIRGRSAVCTNPQARMERTWQIKAKLSRLNPSNVPLLLVARFKRQQQQQQNLAAQTSPKGGPHSGAECAGRVPDPRGARSCVSLAARSEEGSRVAELQPRATLGSPPRENTHALTHAVCGAAGAPERRHELTFETVMWRSMRRQVVAVFPAERSGRSG